MALSSDHLSAWMAAPSIRAASSSCWASSRCSRPMAARSSSREYESSDIDETVAGLAPEEDATAPPKSSSNPAASAAAAAILRACDASLLRRAITRRANRASSICSRCFSCISFSNFRFVECSLRRILDSVVAVSPLADRPGPYDPPYGFRDSMVGCRPPRYLVSSVGTNPVRAAAENMAPLSSSLA